MLIRLASASVAVALSVALSACTTGVGSAADGSEADASSSSSARTVAHARGETAVPAAPQRVVVLEPVALDTTIALGIVPVGAAVLNEAAGVPGYLGDEAASIETVGTVTEPDVEKIASLAPDLVIGTESRHSALYDQLSAVAPTVFLASQADPWKDNVDLVGEALGRADEATALLADYQARCDEIASEFDVSGTAQLIRPRDGLLTLYGPESFAGSTLECVGFETPERDWEDSISVDLSPEKVLDATADQVFVTTTDVSDESTTPEAISDNASAFPELHLVDQSYWITGVGPLGGLAVLDDIEGVLSRTR